MESLPSTRQMARNLGYNKFYTGKPCKNGHTSPRAVSSGSCLTCIKNHAKKWAREQTSDRLAAYTRRYRDKKAGVIDSSNDRRVVFTPEYISSTILEKLGTGLVLAESEVKSGYPILCRCSEHGEVKLWWNNILRGKGCPRCAYLKRRSSTREFIKKAKLIHGEQWGYEKVTYKKATSKVDIMCKTHGVFKQTPNKHLAGQGCPTCSTDPVWERELFLIISDICSDAVRKVKVLDGKEIDVFVPSTSFGVELHGLYWHTERTHSKDYHRRKWQIAQEKGIRLIQVFADEWVNNKDIVLNRIRVALGKSEMYHARKTLLGVVPSADADAFFKEHHTQGSSRFTVCYGLRFNGEWVAMASFGKARTGAMVSGDSGVWEVLRYASKGRVRGGFSKLFKRFLQDYSPEKVVSYCDLRYGTGDLYRATGFTLDGITEPDYWWVTPNMKARVPRYQTQKHKLATHPVLKEFYDPAKTEVEICHAAGWYRIYGVGHQRWLWKAA